MTNLAFHDQHSDIVTDPTSGLIVKTQQLIPSSFIEQNRADYAASVNSRAGEFHQVASIPVSVVQKWKREGFDIMGDPSIKLTAIMRRLRAEEMADFITSAKRI